MVLEALVLSSDVATLRPLHRVLAGMEFSVAVCARPEQAMAEAQRKKFDTVIIDCDDVEGGGGVLKALHDSPSSKHSIAVAVLNRVTSMHDAFVMGAHFVLDKPIMPERALRSLRAARGFMLAERRRYFRQPLNVPVFLSFGVVQDLRCLSSNVSEGGMCLRACEPLRVGTVLDLHFELPRESTIQAEAEVAWSEPDGRSGMRFRSLPSAGKRVLHGWLLEQATKIGLNPDLALAH